MLCHTNTLTTSSSYKSTKRVASSASCRVSQLQSLCKKEFNTCLCIYNRKLLRNNLNMTAIYDNSVTYIKRRFNFCQRFQFSHKLKHAVISKGLSLHFMCSDQHVKYWGPRGFPLTSCLILDYHVKQYINDNFFVSRKRKK